MRGSTRAITGPAPQSTARRASPKPAMPLCVRRSTCRHLSAMRFNPAVAALAFIHKMFVLQATGTLPEATKERRPVALRNLRVTEFVVRHRQVVLPGGATGVRLRQTLKDIMRGLVTAQSRSVAVRNLHVADLAVRHDRSRCQPALSGSASARRSRDTVRGLVAGQRRLACRRTSRGHGSLRRRAIQPSPQLV
jgi:hypothetical protein